MATVSIPLIFCDGHINLPLLHHMPPFNLHALNLTIISPHSGVGQCVKERLVVVVQVAAASVWRVKRNVHLNVNSYRLWYTAILRYNCGVDVLLEFTS